MNVHSWVIQFFLVIGLICSFSFVCTVAHADGPVNPYSFSAVPGSQLGSVKLNWFDDPHPNQFNLLYGTSPTARTYGVVNLPDVPIQPNSYIVNYLNPGQTYYFTLVGITGNTSNESGPVSAQAAVTQSITPTAGSSAQTTSGALLYGLSLRNASTPDTVNVTWTDNATAGKYDIVYGTTPGKYIYGVQNVPFTPRQTNTYPIGALKQGTTYYFALVAERNNYVIVWTNPVSITVR